MLVALRPNRTHLVSTRLNFREPASSQEWSTPCQNEHTKKKWKVFRLRHGRGGSRSRSLISQQQLFKIKLVNFFFRSARRKPQTITARNSCESGWRYFCSACVLCCCSTEASYLLQLKWVRARFSQSTRMKFAFLYFILSPIRLVFAFYHCLPFGGLLASYFRLTTLFSFEFPLFLKHSQCKNFILSPENDCNLLFSLFGFFSFSNAHFA